MRTSRMMWMAVAVLVTILAAGVAGAQEKGVGQGSGGPVVSGGGPAGLGAACDTIAMTGQQSWDLFGDPSNTVILTDYSAGPCLSVDNIGWTAITFSTVGASWGSEANVNMAASNGSSGFDIVFFPTGTMPGVFGPTSGSAGMGVTLLGDMVLRTELFESFDDVSNAVDGNYTGGTMDVEGGVVPVELTTFDVE